MRKTYNEKGELNSIFTIPRCT